MYVTLDIPEFSCARRYDSVSSTMDLAREILSKYPPSNAEWSAVVTADKQTAGRGRQGRVWLASQGSLMVTYIFVTDLPIAALAGYSLAVGVAVAEELEGLGIKNALKWPNDIVVLQGEQSLRKIGGVLIEVQQIAGLQCILVGLGINVAPAPSEVSDISVSLHELGAVDVSAHELVAPIGASLRKWHQNFITSAGFKGVRSAWIQRSCFQSGLSKVTVDLGAGRLISGVFAGVDENGAMVVEASGEFHPIVSGHITSFVLLPEGQR